MHAVCQDGVYTPDANYLRSPEESLANGKPQEESRADGRSHEEDAADGDQELDLRSSSASSVRSGINEKGDSAKNLNAFDQCKSPGKLEQSSTKEPLSTIASQEMLH